MKQAKVIGRVFCSRQCCGMESKTLLLIQPLDWETDKPAGDPLVAGDTVGAGSGETAVNANPPPVDAAIVGIIDGKTIRV